MNDSFYITRLETLLSLNFQSLSIVELVHDTCLEWEFKKIKKNLP